MNSGVTIQIGVVVARESTEHSWEPLGWRPVSVLLNPPPRADWREVGRGKSFVHYHAVTLPLVLDQKCTMHYRVNLANGVPSLYVVVRTRPGADADVPIDVSHVSASPFEVEEYVADPTDHVERVPMPAELVAMVERFIAETASACARLELGGNRMRERDDASFLATFYEPMPGLAHGK